MSQPALRQQAGSPRRFGLIEAALAGEGVGRVAGLAAAQLRGSVAIVLPGLGVAELAPAGDPSAIVRYVGDRLQGRPAQVPADLTAEAPVLSGDEALGTVALLGGTPESELLEQAALAALTAVTLRHTGLTQRRAAAILFDELERTPAEEIVVRAKRLGADLSQGATAMSVRVNGAAEPVLAAIRELPGTLAAQREDRVDALIPSDALRLARRLQRRAAVGLAPFAPDVAELHRALQIAARSLELAESGVAPEELLGGSWRLLLAAEPAAVAALLDSTVGPLQSRPELLDTLRAYLDQGANMNATATAVFAHRHTVAHRLERIRALTGHDPLTPGGQAELALGLRASVVSGRPGSRRGRGSAAGAPSRR
jgi:hypothetical protein